MRGHQWRRGMGISDSVMCTLLDSAASYASTELVVGLGCGQARLGRGYFCLAGIGLQRLETVRMRGS